MGYGSVPTMKEYNEDGDVVLSMSWGEAEAVQSYRTYKSPWVGKPSTNPDVFACKGANGTVVYMSWNGATEVQRWTVFGGAQNGTLEEVARVKKSGFETKAVVTGELGYIKAEASGEGIDIGVSEVVAVLEQC
jgi:hypothetical protein